MDPDEQEEWEAVFADKIVLVGDTWEVTHDKFTTPMGQAYGVEIIANTISTLMNGAPLRPAGTGVESAATLGVLVLLLVTGVIRSFALRGMATLVVMSLYVAALTAAYIYGGLVVSMTYGLLAGFVCVILMSIRQYLLSEQMQVVSAADSAESNRMLGLAYQGQGQLDAAFEKFRRSPREEATFELVYSLGLDYERKRQYNKAQASYEFIAETNADFRDVRLIRTRIARPRDFPRGQHIYRFDRQNKGRPVR